MALCLEPAPCQQADVRMWGVWHLRHEPCGARPSAADRPLFGVPRGRGQGCDLSETPLSCAASSTLQMAICPCREDTESVGAGSHLRHEAFGGSPAQWPVTVLKSIGWLSRATSHCAQIETASSLRSSEKTRVARSGPAACAVTSAASAARAGGAF